MFQEWYTLELFLIASSFLYTGLLAFEIYK